ncbi:hypothetical protein [Emticicia fluvialis]|uniref:hypothetical protein n=1 Tax=Emticicia fluvialis TaxID=2974474 RepID=UPI0021665139|nr:hypothetical protein [Emticicia fluvialis]
MRKSKEIPIVSQPEKNYAASILLASLFLVGYFWLLANSIILVSWVLLFVAVLCLFGSSYLILNLSKYIYYFYSDRIIIATPKNEYLDEIKISDIVAWNIEYFKSEGYKSNKILVFKTIEKTIFISSRDYKNFSDFISFFRKRKLSVDPNLKSTFEIALLKRIPGSERIGPVAILVSIILTIATFWILVREKSDSDERIYFVSEITNIYIKRRGAELELKDFPTLNFHTGDKTFFQPYYYNNGDIIYTNQGKTIKIGVLKSEYDWRLKNKFIRKISMSSETDLFIENFRILDNSTGDNKP